MRKAPVTRMIVTVREGTSSSCRHTNRLARTWRMKAQYLGVAGRQGPALLRPLLGVEARSWWGDCIMVCIQRRIHGGLCPCGAAFTTEVACGPPGRHTVLSALVREVRGSTRQQRFATCGSESAAYDQGKLTCQSGGPCVGHVAEERAYGTGQARASNLRLLYSTPIAINHSTPHSSNVHGAQQLHVHCYPLDVSLKHERVLQGAPSLIAEWRSEARYSARAEA